MLLLLGMTGEYTTTLNLSIATRFSMACSLRTFRGSKTVSVLANLYPNRFLAFGFLTVGYLPPTSIGTSIEELRDSVSNNDAHNVANQADDVLSLVTGDRELGI